jgi:hypothetical protein
MIWDAIAQVFKVWFAKIVNSREMKPMAGAVVRQNSIWYKNVMSFKFGPDLIGVFSGRERSF